MFQQQKITFAFSYKSFETVIFRQGIFMVKITGNKSDIFYFIFMTTGVINIKI